MNNIIDKILEIKAEKLNKKITMLQNELEEATLSNLKKQKQKQIKKKLDSISKLLNIK